VAARAGVALLVTCAALQVAGIVAGPVLTAGAQTIPQWARLPGTFLLVLYGLLGWLTTRCGLRRYSGLIAGGILLGHLGDLAMGGVIPSPNGWLAGMLLFGIGHAFYIAGFVRFGCDIQGSGRARTTALVVAETGGVAIWLWLVARSSQGPVMEYGALGYTLIICAMTGLAAALTVRERRLWPMLAGALLFLLSDVMLGAAAFHGTGGAVWNDAIWVIYIGGQALLVTSPRHWGSATSAQEKFRKSSKRGETRGRNAAIIVEQRAHFPRRRS
jgi:hypothetical protein